MTRTTKEILTEANQISTPDSGARTPAGKEGICTVRCNSLPPASAVTEAKEVKGKAKECIDQQAYGEGKRKLVGGGNPKARTPNYWGADQDKKEV